MTDRHRYVAIGLEEVPAAESEAPAFVASPLTMLAAGLDPAAGPTQT